MSHTPTPWYVGGPMDFDKYIIQANRALAHVHQPDAKANAEFVVKACNSHEELLRACKLASETIGYVTDASKEQYVIEALEKAIARAEGEA